MTPFRCFVAALAGFVVLAGACTKEYQPTAADLASTTTMPPTRPGVIGERVQYGGIDLVVSDITAFERSPEGIPRFRAVIRSENLVTNERDNPIVGLTCKEGDDLGDWVRGSTWEAGSVLPAGVVNQGELIVRFPLKPDAPLYAVGTCTEARLRVEISAPNLPVQVIEYAVPDDVVTDAMNRPRGKAMPLPLAPN